MTAAASRPDWGNLELNLPPVPPATPQQRRAAQQAVCARAVDVGEARVLLAMLGLDERIPA